MQLKALIIAILALQLSGISPTWAAHRTASLESLINRARHPFAPGSQGGKPTLEDLARAEKDLATHRIALEDRFESLSQDEKLAQINSYMNEVSLLTSLRIALQIPHGLEWAQSTALHLSKSLLPELPALGATAQNKLGDRFFPLVVESNRDRNQFQLRISAALIQGLELGQLADHPNSESYLTVVQYLAIRQLLQNLAEVRVLKKDHTVTPPLLSPLLTRKLEGLKLREAIEEEARRTKVEPAAKAAIVKALTGVLETSVAPPQFVTPQLVSKLAKIIAPSRGLGTKIRPALNQALEDAETHETESSLVEELNTIVLPLSSLPPAELEIALRKTFVASKTNSVLQRIMELMSMGILPELEISSRKEILSVLENTKDQYALWVSDRFLSEWRKAARQVPEEILFETRRLQFVTELMGHAAETLENTQKDFTLRRIHLPALFSAFHEERQKLRNRSASANFEAWIEELQSAQDYPAAQLRFQQRALRFYSEKNSPHSPTFSKEVPAELAEKIRKRIEEGRTKDITAYLALGKIMGFSQVSAQVAADPSALLAQILPQQEKLDRYFSAIRETAKANQPLLSSEIQFNGKKTTLAEALVNINPSSVSDLARFTQSENLVEQALKQVETAIHQNIKKVSEASHIEDIEKVVNSSMMMALVFRGFRELTPVQDEWLRQATSSSTSELIMHRYISGYLTWGGSALMLIHGGKWLTQMTFKKAFPYADLMATAADGILAGYMKSFTSVLIADSAYQGFDTWTTRTDTKESESLFSSSATRQGGLIDTTELSEARGAYQVAKWSFVARMGMDTALMYLPMIRGLAKASGDSSLVKQMMQNSSDFASLGLKADAFDQVEIALQRIQQEGSPHLKQAQEAAARLIERRNVGQTYSLDTTFKRILIEDAFQTLLLKSSKESSWTKIDEALERVSHSGKSAQDIRTAQSAADFLRELLKRHPNLPQQLKQEARSIPEYERKLVEALGRTQSIDQAWKEELRGTL